MTTALPLVARPDLEGYVQAMKEDGVRLFSPKCSTSKRSPSCARPWMN